MLKKVGKLALAVAFASSMMIPAAALSAFGAADSQISVSGLDTGDTAKYYQIVKEGNGGWELNGTYGDLTIDDILNGIDAEEAGIIAGALNNGATGGTDMTVESKTATATVDPGTYLVFVTPADNATIYAPIFVSADYSQAEASPNTIDASAQSLPTPPIAVAKKTTEEVTKTAVSSNPDNDASTSSVAVGDKVSFQVESTVPSFTSNVVNPTFKVSDSVSTGLEIDTTSVEVKVGTEDAQEVELNGFYNVDGSDATETDYDFKVSALSTSTWKIEFSAAYLTTQATGNPAVVVTYDATVTSDAAKNVNQMKNTAEIEYTHTPDGTTASDEDDTKHYTYSLDAPIAGSTTQGHGGNSSELVKTGVDENGDPITEETDTHNWSTGDTTYNSPLEGATFELKGVTNNKTYTAQSDADGLFSFKGLDAGEYTLKETVAPAGYQLDKNVYNIKIDPTFASDGTLESYQVLIKKSDEDESAYKLIKEFEITCDATTGEITSAEPTTATVDNHEWFKNIPLPKLPTTGGAGTMGLTAAGIILIAGGALYFIRSRRRNEQQ